jgi:peptidoglycan/LPS O-acetylase OafA/YrhL
VKLIYYKNLDGVRGIAALMVIWFHFFTLPIIKNYDASWLPSAIKVADFGQTGVSLFFVLSGFLITRILLNSKNQDNFFSNFYIRRALRIFPLYYFFLFIFFYLQPLFSGLNITPFVDQFYSLIYLQNFASTFNWQHNKGPGHFWSLAVEEHFYLFWPLIIYYFNIRNTVVIIVSIILVTFIVKMLMLNNGYFIGYFTFTRIDQLAIGAILALIERRPIKKQVQVFVFLFFTATIFVGVLIFYLNDRMLIAKELLKYPVLAFFYFSIIGLLISIKKNNFINQLLTTKYFSYSGKISYGLYVYHPLAISLVAHKLLTGNIFVDFIFCFFVTYIFASLSYYLIEVRFLKLKDRFTLYQAKN